MSRRWERSVQQNKVRHLQIQGRACITYITLQIVVKSKTPRGQFQKKGLSNINLFLLYCLF